MMRRLVVLAVVAVVAAFVYPAVSAGPNLDKVAQALALAGPAAGTALAAATGRPLLAAAAMSGAGAYVSGLVSLHGVPVPLAVLCGAAAAGAAGALCALVGTRLDGAGFLIATLLLAIAGGAAVQALPGITGAQAGLGPLPPISFPLGANKSAVFTPVGNFHVLLAVAAIATAVSAMLIAHGPGPAWRAVGSDRRRARDSGINVLAAEAGALAVAGVVAGISGALAAHVATIATPSSFAPDVAALPLLAALAAAREPLVAALVAVGTGLVGQLILPAAGWQGPPDAMSLSLGVLAVATLFTLLPSGVGRREPGGAEIDTGSPWPLNELDVQGAPLSIDPITIRSKDGALMVDAPAIDVQPGSILAVVGANGSGKTTLLHAIAKRARGGPARILLLPQDGGGFSACTVDETLTLAARRGRSAGRARELAGLWLHRLGLEASREQLCVELSGGQRRLLDLARVLLSAPQVVLCDEPLAGLDDNHRAAAVGCLRAAADAGLTIVLAEHDRQAVYGLAADVVELQRAEVTQDLAAAPAST
jgi:ABC-type branched-subunit amino acid transport system ATPase component/ABC-type branched-subunit amino acid transport system permease subunit